MPGCVGARGTLRNVTREQAPVRARRKLVATRLSVEPQRSAGRKKTPQPGERCGYIAEYSHREWRAMVDEEHAAQMPLEK